MGQEMTFITAIRIAHSIAWPQHKRGTSQKRLWPSRCILQVSLSGGPSLPIPPLQEAACATPWGGGGKNESLAYAGLGRRNIYDSQVSGGWAVEQALADLVTLTNTVNMFGCDADYTILFGISMGSVVALASAERVRKALSLYFILFLT